ncbi:MAG: hypothetical protein LLF96_06665 [Eubacteriales bacterium]|nr:hypothetical protein [Eubacteriales bacterium]
MKKRFTLLLVVCLCLTLNAVAVASSPTLSYTPLELHLPAAGLMIYVPADMDRLEGDEEAYDLGFRYYCYTDTFSFTLYVHDSRDMNSEEYADFYAERNGYTVLDDTTNGVAVKGLTSNDVPGDYVALVSSPGTDSPAAIYELAFSCTGDDDVALANEIMSTLTTY